MPTTPVLVFNCGSSSVKYQVIDVDSEAVWATGLVERVGEPQGGLTHRTGERTETVEAPIPDHATALELVVQAFRDWGPDLGQVVAVGHRAVHGGERFRAPTIIDQSVIDGLTELIGLAPLHNPPNIIGIQAARRALPQVPHVAVFDTAFFATLPPEAHTYAIDRQLALAHGIRKYGFHGTSHAYVSGKVAQVLGRDLGDFDQIVCHLGNGASISAVQGGVAVETSMGLTPLPGLVMGTRSGDIDPGVFAYLARVAGLDSGQVDELLNKSSGMAGLTGGLSDFRDIRARIDQGDPDAQLAFDVYIHRLVAYIGSYLALLGGVDALSFTAGVGENDSFVRQAVCDRLAPLGFVLDPQANAVRSGQPRVISASQSPVTILVVPTNEELALARDTVAAIGIRS
ncbi:MAG: acetate kinase [Propionibacteriaceae bacterium]|nr:acetate kinase [Propionibacteriaceae bacterium]